jgi:dTDP-4-amino-4,6-dideoxygalactose transaminase
VRVPLVDLKAQHASIAADLALKVGELVAQQAFILGPAVATFEATLARLTGAPHAVGVGSGSDALLLALRAAGIGPGHAVITGAFGFVATPEAVVRAGAVPIFADIDGFLVTAGTIERVLATMRRRADGAHVDPASGAIVRGILVSHLFGESVATRDLVQLARATGHEPYAVVEDAAQAILSTDDGVLAGSQGDFAALSFFPTKNLGGWGDGGAVLGKDPIAMQRVRRLRQHGIDGGRFVEVGMNSRLDALQAVVLEVKAQHIEAWTVRREAIARRYREGLGSLEGRLELPPATRPGSRHVYHQFVVRTGRRDALARHLEALGVETRAYYRQPLHREPCFGGIASSPVALDRAEAAAESSLGLPIYAELTPAAQEHVMAGILAFFAT